MRDRLTCRLVNARETARQIAIGRMGFGIAFMSAPGFFGRMWVGPDASRPAGKLLFRALGARDLALGMGTLLSMRHERPTRGWLEASGLADFADFMATLLAGDSIAPVSRYVTFAIAGPSAALCGLTAARVDYGREQVKHADQA
jgi:hypothetical protein